MNKQDKRDEKLIKEIVAIGNTRKINKTFEEMKKSFVENARLFNLIREEMVRVKNVMWNIECDNKRYISEMTSLTGNDAMSFVAKIWDIKPNEVEDADRFEVMINDIKKTGNPLLRIRKCTKARKALDESIESWKSKISSMKERAERLDGNRNEADICNRKIIAFKLVVGDLEKRNDAIFETFHSTKKNVESFLKNQSDFF